MIKFLDLFFTQAEVSRNGILLRLRHLEMKNRQLRNTLLQHQKKLNRAMRGLMMMFNELFLCTLL